MPSPTPRDSSVTIPAAAARRIDAALTKYPKVLKENKKLRTANRAYAAGLDACNEEVGAKDSVIVRAERQLATAKVLGQDAENRAAISQRKASKRGWQNVGLAALLLLVTVVAVR